MVAVVEIEMTAGEMTGVEVIKKEAVEDLSVVVVEALIEMIEEVIKIREVNRGLCVVAVVGLIETTVETISEEVVIQVDHFVVVEEDSIGTIEVEMIDVAPTIIDAEAQDLLEDQAEDDQLLWPVITIKDEEAKILMDKMTVEVWSEV